MTTKKTIKVRDLKPNKDAKGGGAHAINRAGVNGASSNSSASNSTGANSHQASRGNRNH